MEKQQVEPNNNVNGANLPYAQQGEVYSEKIPEEMTEESDLLPENLHAELEFLRSLIKELKEEISKKDLSISFLRKDREILIDENERLEEKLENYKAEHWEYCKRKITLL